MNSIQVWDGDNAQIVDYVGLHVSAAITPQSVLATLGDVICFSTPLQSPEGEIGNLHLLS